MPSDAAHALNELVKILDPLSPDDRRRAIKGAMAFLGEDWSPASGSPTEHTPEPSKADGTGHWTKAHAWMKQNGISADQLDHVFEFDKDKLQINGNSSLNHPARWGIVYNAVTIARKHVSQPVFA